MRKLSTLLVCLLLALSQLMAQNRTISGKVTDEKGNPVANASVIAKGSTRGTTTAADGSFSIAVPPTAKSLVISSVNFNTQEISVTGKSSVTVGLVNSQSDLSEVVVVGYQTVSKKNLTGSVAKISGETFENKPILSFDQALTSKAPGIQVNTASGLVGDNVYIRIRGISSLSSGLGPLIILDGVPLITGDQGQLYNPANALAEINPADIESVDVLKDAAAASIYGSRGTNGVILITTKKGKAGTSNINYDMYVGVVNPTRKLGVLNGDQYITTINKMRSNAGLANAAGYFDFNGDGVTDKFNTDWQDSSFRHGFTQNHQVSVSGGAGKSTYYGSANFNDYQNYVIVNRQKRGSARLNISTKVNDFLEVGFKTQFSRTISYGLGSGTGAALSGFPYGAVTSAPDVPIRDPRDPSGYYIGNGGNTVATGTPNAIAVQNLNHDTRTANTFLGSAYGEAQIIKGLKFKSQISIDYENAYTDQFWNPFVGDGVGVGVAQSVYSQNSTWDWYNTLSYTKKIHDHEFGILAGAEYTRTTSLYSYVSGAGINDPRFKAITGGNYQSLSAENSTPTETPNNGMASYFGSVNYGYKGKYLATFNIRRDAYSGYGADNKWGNFPGASIAWRMTEENFMKRIHWLNDLKVRASYGVTGNSAIGSFPAVAIYAPAQYADLTGLGLSTPGNTKLKWEKTAQFDFGFDALLWKKTSVTIDYYNKKTIDLVFNNPILSTAGLGTTLTQNIGKMNNTGLEVSIGTPIISKKDFSWDVNLNFTTNKAKVVKINDNGDNIVAGYGLAQAGYNLNAAYLIRWAGVNPANGLPTFLDVNGVRKQYDFSQPTASRWTLVSDKTVTTAIGATDRVIDNKKTPYPKYFGGLSQTLRYKGFDLSIDLQYAFGFYLYNSTKTTMMSWSNTKNKSTDILRAWTTPGQVTDVQRLYYGDNFWTANANTRWLEKGDFLRIRNVQFGYNFPKSMLNRAKIQKLRVYVQVQNVYTFTGYKGIDPESVNSGAAVGFGVDQLRAYLPRVMTAGINLGF